MTTDNIIVDVCYDLEEDRGIACLILENHMLYHLRVGGIEDTTTDEDSAYGKARVVYFEAPRDKVLAFFEELDKEEQWEDL